MPVLHAGRWDKWSQLMLADLFQSLLRDCCFTKLSWDQSFVVLFNEPETLS